MNTREAWLPQGWMSHRDMHESHPDQGVRHICLHDLADPAAQFRGTCACYLRRHFPQDWADLAQQHLGDPDIGVRQCAAESVAEVDPDRGYALMLSLLISLGSGARPDMHDQADMVRDWLAEHGTRAHLGALDEVDPYAAEGLRSKLWAGNALTEEEWLLGAAPPPGSYALLQAMLRWLDGRATRRKPRLWAVAACRLAPDWPRDTRAEHALAAAERHADGEIGLGQLRAIRQPLLDSVNGHREEIPGAAGGLEVVSQPSSRWTAVSLF